MHIVMRFLQVDRVGKCAGGVCVCGGGVITDIYSLIQTVSNRHFNVLMHDHALQVSLEKKMTHLKKKKMSIMSIERSKENNIIYVGSKQQKHSHADERFANNSIVHSKTCLKPIKLKLVFTFIY